jgi:hypothetical protein
MTNAEYLLFVDELDFLLPYINIGKDVLKNSIVVFFIILNTYMYIYIILVMSIFIIKTSSALHTCMDYQLLVLLKNY